MALPNPIQRLKHGAFLCKKNFMTFVETFNFLIDFAQNLRGDGDGHEDGLITVDKTAPDRPIIRSKRGVSFFDKVEKYVSTPSCFEMENLQATRGQDDSVVVTGELKNCYIQVSGKSFVFGVGSSTFMHTISEDAEDVLSIEISATYGTGTPTFEYRWDGTFAYMQMWQSDPTKMIIPLYQFNSEGEVVCDFRNIPTFVMGEWT